MPHVTTGSKVLATFDDAQRPEATSQMVSVVEMGPEWTTVCTSDGRDVVIHTACLSRC